MAQRDYYRLSQEKLMELLDTSPEKGLSSRNVERKRRQYGINKLPSKNKKGIISIFLDQFKDFMIIVLMIATVLSLFMGEFSDAITIFAIIVLNAIMGFVQEYRAEKSLAALQRLTAPVATTVRNNKIVEINAEELVPGDIILLKIGDKVPADVRILSSDNLQADESILTGESVPVSKSVARLYAKNLPPQKQKNILFMGSTITRGNARAVIVNTGTNTEIGKIASMLENDNQNITPLQRRLQHLGKWLVIFSILITVLIVLVGIFKGQSIYQMFMAGVSLAVAAIPEGLPAIVTISLAIGVQKMIKKNAIVRKLPAVETLGCATVICSDKTGTLTKNQMSLSKIYINRRLQEFDLSLQEKGLEKFLSIGAICNDAQPREKKKEGPLEKVKEFFTGNQPPDLLGDPTDIALIQAVYNHNLSFFDMKKQYRLLAKKEFESRRKRMSVLIENQNQKELWIKGAPEIIVNLCNYVYINGKKTKITPSIKNELLHASNSMAGEALRVLALAYKPVQGHIRKDQLEELENNLVLMGFAGLIDPPRPEVYQAVKNCQKAGIKPVMITGDHRITARVIAEELGIISRQDKVVIGDELRSMSSSNLKELVKEVQVFARIAPEDKLKIVRAFKENGEIVAMTGDGVNDAPAVKESDIGVAMGKKGTDVTREVSSLILADDNFATIVAAIKEGRKIYNNIRKFIRYLLSCNIGELLTVFMGIAMGLPLPLLPIQILWVNLVTDGLPAMALGLDESNDNIMKKPPRQPDESLFAHGMVSKIASQGLLIGLSTMIAFLLALFKLETGIEIARTMAFSTLVFSQLFFVFSCRSEEKNMWQVSLFSNLYLIGAVLISTIMQLLVIYNPVFHKLFKTTFLNNEQWFIVLILSIWSPIFLDMIDNIIRRFSKN